MSDYTPPTADEISRVGAYWQRVKDMACDHPTLTFGSISSPDTPHCADCKRPLQILSDIQVDDRRKAWMDNSLNGTLAQQLERGGVRFLDADGVAQEVRLRAYPDEAFPHNEFVGMSVESIQSMLRATDVL